MKLQDDYYKIVIYIYNNEIDLYREFVLYFDQFSSLKSGLSKIKKIMNNDK